MKTPTLLLTLALAASVASAATTNETVELNLGKQRELSLAFFFPDGTADLTPNKLVAGTLRFVSLSTNVQIRGGFQFAAGSTNSVPITLAYGAFAGEATIQAWGNFTPAEGPFRPAPAALLAERTFRVIAPASTPRIVVGPEL